MGALLEIMYIIAATLKQLVVIRRGNESVCKEVNWVQFTRDMLATFNGLAENYALHRASNKVHFTKCIAQSVFHIGYFTKCISHSVFR